MANFSPIPKNELKSLYKNKKLTISKIAKFYNCSTSKIWAYLWKYNINRSRCKQVFIFKKDLEKLYLKEKLSTRKIAKRYNCGKSTIESKLRQYGIVVRNKSEVLKLIPRVEKYKISKEKLKKLYDKGKFSAYKIAKIYNCSPSAIFHKLRKFNIPRRTDVEGIILTNNERCRKIAKAVSRYVKKNFNSSATEKAHMIGFSLGDMNVAKKKYGETIYVSSSTTKNEQVVLMKNLFKKFGHINIKKSKKNTRNGEKDNFHFVAHLNSSFDFLLNKRDKIEKWILEKNKYFLPFLAGYIDAEGSFGVYNGFGEFALGSYDKNIIGQIHHKLKFLGIKSENPRIMVKGGYVDRRGVRTLKDLWSLRIRRKSELSKFINLIKPYIKHLKRKRDLLRVKENVISRLKN
ncbi:MAG: hypothetical protein COS25_00510 [Candidatus Nealsonbacteria bacterium CG02_land_8_20_14_3_00_37_10]|uniref:DOD-type homing endonuclease domain-containing protein n=1 Tax=Candidatus Nealsonbacteria bacterium CG02_land_8_20_14_3_00_37_10 TaxID=1974699 RepID=A0A2M7DA58_9BACT|nr:MAG: hypothetical protein COS25_00510 [Candidatus Nealsonbacteria bacterium CG02_land_8_20_14_3_00_37_10]